MTPAKTIDKLPEPKKEPPRPTPKPVAAAPAVTAPTTTATTAASNGVAAHAATAAGAPHSGPHAPAKPAPLPKAGSIPRPTEVIELQSAAQFNPGAWADYIKSFHGKATEVDVQWGTLAPRTSIQLQWDKDLGFVTQHGGYQPLPIVQPFFARLPEALALFIHVRGDKIDGFAAPLALKQVTPGHKLALPRALGESKVLSALGLVGFHLPSPTFGNQIQDGHFSFGAPDVGFSIGWLSGHLKLDLVDDKVAFTASADIEARGLAGGHLTVTRDKDGNYAGQAEIPVTLGKASGNVLAKYDDGQVSVTGTIKYASEKFSGSLTVMFGEANEVKQAARGQLDPGKLLTEQAAKEGEKAEHAKKGEKGVGAWGQFDFAFTDWMTGTALGILDPFGHITIVGKIAPPKEVILMKRPDPLVKNLVHLPFRARYGLPYVADVHIGFDFDLDFTAWIGPAVLTGIEVGGTYSTDPEVKQDFYLSGKFRIDAYAGLTLGVSVLAGLTILDHDIDAVGTITGSAGLKAYAAADATIGYREKEDPVAGKKGEAYLQGHLEAAAQPVLGLGGKFEVKLSTPWWSPVSDHTWTFPLFNYEWPLASSLGVGADIDYVIGSGKFPDIKFGQVDFDASKFADAALDDNVPAKSGKSETEKPGTWKGVAPTPPSAPAKEVPKGPEPVGGKPPRAGAPAAKSGKGKQTPEQAANVPKTPDASQRWLEGLRALGELHDLAEKHPETSSDIHSHLAFIKSKYGFSKLTPTRDGSYWDIDAEMNPSTKKPKIKAAPTATPTSTPTSTSTPSATTTPQQAPANPNKKSPPAPPGHRDERVDPHDPNLRIVDYGGGAENDGSTFVLDAQGRTVRAIVAAEGSHPGRKKIGAPDPSLGRLPGEHRGHLGPEGSARHQENVNVPENVISEAARSNLSPKKIFDNLLAKTADANPGKVVTSGHTPIYAPGATRPHSVEHVIIVDGKIIHSVTIPNQ